MSHLVGRQAEGNTTRNEYGVLGGFEETGREEVKKDYKKMGAKAVEKPDFFMGGCGPTVPTGPKRKLRNSWMSKSDTSKEDPPRVEHVPKPFKKWTPIAKKKLPPRSQSHDGTLDPENALPTRKGRRPQPAAGAAVKTDEGGEETATEEEETGGGGGGAAAPFKRTQTAPTRTSRSILSKPIANDSSAAAAPEKSSAPKDEEKKEASATAAPPPTPPTPRRASKRVSFTSDNPITIAPPAASAARSVSPCREPKAAAPFKRTQTAPDPSVVPTAKSKSKSPSPTRAKNKASTSPPPPDSGRSSSPLRRAQTTEPAWQPDTLMVKRPMYADDAEAVPPEEENGDETSGKSVEELQKEIEKLKKEKGELARELKKTRGASGMNKELKEEIFDLKQRLKKAETNDENAKKFHKLENKLNTLKMLMDGKVDLTSVDSMQDHISMLNMVLNQDLKKGGMNNMKNIWA